LIRAKIRKNFLATGAVIGEAFAKRTMALCGEQLSSQNSFFNQADQWQSVDLRTLANDAAQATP
jgi:hypothetical protein